MTVISLQKGTDGEKYVKEYLEKEGWFGKVIIVNEENNEHYSAMAASDFGLIHHGQMVSAATVCHLPTMALFDMKKHHQYYHDSFNRWWVDVNLVADNNIYPEIIGGELWKGRICD